jgi:hypothetical protein
LGRIPEAPGDSIEHDGWTLTVTAVDGLRIASVRLDQPADQVDDRGDDRVDGEIGRADDDDGARP